MSGEKSAKTIEDVIKDLRIFIELSLNEKEQSWDEWILATTKRIQPKCWQSKNCNNLNCPAHKNDCGRCWLIAGTMCGGEVQGSFAKKYHSCLDCEIFQESVLCDPVTELQEHLLVLIHSLRNKHQELQQAKERSESERAKAETIIAAIGASLSIQDRDCRILYQNDLCRQMAGNRLGEACFKAYANRNAVCESCPLALSFADGQIHTVERYIISDRFQGWIEIIASPLKNARGEITSCLEIVRDISERKRMEMELVEERDKLREALAEVKTLRGFIPICASCKKIRDDQGYWSQIEQYISAHAEVKFSHGLCPDCAEEFNQKVEAYKRDKAGPG